MKAFYFSLYHIVLTKWLAVIGRRIHVHTTRAYLNVYNELWWRHEQVIQISSWFAVLKDLNSIKRGDAWEPGG